MNYHELGIVVMSYRHRNKINQTDLAQKVCISRNYLSMIERGQAQNLSIEILVSLAKVMNVRPDYLLNILLEQPEQPALIQRSRWA